MKVLLHICCGVCASSVVEQLMVQGHRVTGFFYNSNIHPSDEYKTRLEVARKVARELDFKLIESPYDRERWFEIVKGVQDEPEGGVRCERCIRMRLEKTYEYCRRNNFDAFTTTLTVSPQKEVTLVNDIGREIAGEKFICADFKKKEGFKRAMELSKEWDLYRQHYCGCIYSLESKLAKEKK